MPYPKISAETIILLDPDIIIDLLPLTDEEEITQGLEEHIEEIENKAEQALAGLDMQEDAKLWEATRRFGELYAEMYIRWLDEIIDDLEGREG